MISAGDDLYPIMIRQARYSGAYEGGLWIAIANYEDLDLDGYFHGDDEEAFALFESDQGKLIGVGDTPNDALKDMIIKYSMETVID